MAISGGPDIVEDGLVCCLDAADLNSYPRTGNTWYNLAGENYNTTINNALFQTQNAGCFNLDANGDYMSVNNNYNHFAETVIVWAKSNTSTWNEYGWISSSRQSNGHIIHPSPNTRNVNMYILSSSATYTFLGNLTPSDITIPRMYTLSTNGINKHKYYNNGSPYVTSTVSITRNSTPQQKAWYLGVDDYQSLTRYGNGKIFYCLKYNRQLEDLEVQQIYNATKGRFGL